MSFPLALPCHDFLTQDADAVIVIAANVHDLGHTQLNATLAPYLAVDQRIASKATLVLANDLPGKRLIVSPTGPLHRDYDDVRRVFDDGELIEPYKIIPCRPALDFPDDGVSEASPGHSGDAEMCLDLAGSSVV
ncbi:MAG: hypothetical protein AAF439_12700 [Pseudomonadota bacterium]